jgi:hydrogenase maturation protein HypF
LELTAFLERQPLHVLAAMVERGLNSPLTSSCGRLFDAVAAALGICRESVSYEGQAAIQLEALALTSDESDSAGYAFSIDKDLAPVLIDSKPMWLALLADLEQGIAKSRIAARFHTGLAAALSDLAIYLAGRHNTNTVALSGGVFQNKMLFEQVSNRLTAAHLEVLSHQQVPANDGGLALGQAVVAAAKHRQPGPSVKSGRDFAALGDCRKRKHQIAPDFLSPSRRGSGRFVGRCNCCRNAEGGRKGKKHGMFL